MIVVVSAIVALLFVKKEKSSNEIDTKKVMQGVFPEYEVVESSDRTGKMLYFPFPYIEKEENVWCEYFVLYGEYIVGVNDQYTFFDDDSKRQGSTQYLDIIVKNINTQEEYTISLTDYMKKNDFVRDHTILDKEEIEGMEWLRISIDGGYLYVNPLTGEIIPCDYDQHLMSWGYLMDVDIQLKKAKYIAVERDELLELPAEDSIFTNYPDLKNILIEMPDNKELYFFTDVQ